MPWFWVTIPTSLWLIAADVSLLRRGPRVGGRLSFRLRVGFSFALRFSHARTGGWRGLARLVPMVQAQARPDHAGTVKASAGHPALAEASHAAQPEVRDASPACSPKTHGRVTGCDVWTRLLF